jgi:ArsR family transcriptional regulator, arsenate/arsenite/antimonite-responsive transcriptional repressor
MSVLPVVDRSGPACCPPPLQVEALATQTAGQLAPMFKALGDPIRLRLLSLIASTAEVCVCDLTDAFDVTGATISHHLRVLRETGLVEVERRGTWAYYRVKRDVLDLLGGLLTGSAEPPDRSAGTATEATATHQTKLISASPDVVRLLGDPLRAQIVRLLADGPATTSHLVADTGAKQPNVSGHLKQLREAGVVAPEPRGRFTYYRLVPESLQGAALHLADLAADAAAHSDTFRDC